MKKFLFLLVCFAGTVHAQHCSCTDNFNWLKETFEKNDAGFQYAIEQKGWMAYKKHSDLYREKVKQVKTKEDCAALLAGWLRFFRKGHLWLGVNMDEHANSESPEKTRTRFKSWEQQPYDQKEFTAYLSSLPAPGLEGVWATDSYTVGIRKIKKDYIAFIINADGAYWSPGQVRFKIRDSSGYLSATYYKKDRALKDIR